jgi:glycosyltransferase involved in cell wall biosynthesis
MNKVKFCIAQQVISWRRFAMRRKAAQIAEFTGFVKKTESSVACRGTFHALCLRKFGLSALEAAQFNVPCVISNQSGVTEVLHNVLKADFWDTDKLANYLYAVLNYNGLRETMTRLTSIDIKNISWDNSAREVLKSYKHVLHREDEQEQSDKSIGL